MKSVIAKFLAVAMLAVGFAAPTFADFSGPYDLSLWTQTNGPGGTGGTTIDISGAPNILIFNGGDSDLGCVGSDCIVRFSIPVAGTGNITFDWSFNADDSCCELFGFGVNGVPTQLSSFPVPVNGSEERTRRARRHVRVLL